MTGRLFITSPTQVFRGQFDIDIPFDQDANFNISPNEEIGVIRLSEDVKVFDRMTWNLTPYWAKKTSVYTNINAHVDDLTTKGLWQAAFQQARCLVPVDGYFEWMGEEGDKQPFKITRSDGKPMALAGIWSINEKLGTKSCAIVVTQPNEFLSDVRNQMPVILDIEGMDHWLCEPSVELLKPYDGNLRIWPVDKYVNNPANKGPTCIEELVLETGRIQIG